jgi:uncharacterized membrane protein YeaQ/YmgE (transglycosylase-associated protein family)
VGLIGAFVGGLIVSPFIHGNTTVHFWGTTAIATLGAVVLLFVLRIARS